MEFIALGQPKVIDNHDNDPKEDIINNLAVGNESIGSKFDEIENLMEINETKNHNAELTNNETIKVKEEFGSDNDDQDFENNNTDTFYFESDHLSLRDNADYKKLLYSLVLLESQRSQAVRDLDVLLNCKKKALENPINFVARLQKSEDVGLPRPIKVASIPQINWGKYTNNITSFNQNKQHWTRKKGTESSEKSDLQCLGTEDFNSNSVENTPFIVRGRLKDDRKPATFNQLWSSEEQQRLEALLIEYPEEDVESRRWTKIANALGHRTTAQVASRVQKYFLKLARAGLPIPGRRPNVAAQRSNRKVSHRHQRYNRMYFQPSTFLQSYAPPVYMDEDREDSFRNESIPSWPSTAPGSRESSDVSDDESIPVELRSRPEYKEMLQLMKIRKMKAAQVDQRPPVQHTGFCCNLCEMDPIVGTRWHCADCPSHISIDFCDQCNDRLYETETHKSSHNLCAIETTRNIDADYTRFTHGHCNYLDPNYMPIT